MATQGQNQDDQEQRVGGYGGSTGGQDPAQDGASQQGSSAAGREGPVTDAVDGDEAMGNRTGGYGGNPSSVDEPQNGQPD